MCSTNIAVDSHSKHASHDDSISVVTGLRIHITNISCVVSKQAC